MVCLKLGYYSCTTFSIHSLPPMPPSRFRLSSPHPQVCTRNPVRQRRHLGFLSDRQECFQKPDGSLMKKREAHQLNERHILQALIVLAGPCPPPLPTSCHSDHVLHSCDINTGLQISDHLGAWTAWVRLASPLFFTLNTLLFAVSQLQEDYILIKQYPEE